MKLVCALLLVLTFLAFLGCSKPVPGSSPEPTPIPPAPAQALDNDTPEEPGTASEVILKYWEAMNSYDLERTLSYYEENYREQEEEEVAGDISRLRQFDVTLSVKEVSEPVFIFEDKVRHEAKLDTPIGDKNLIYELVIVNGVWKICLETTPEKFLEAQEFIIDFLAKYGTSQRMDLLINAEQQHGIERATADSALAELVKSGDIVELREGVYSLPGSQ